MHASYDDTVVSRTFLWAKSKVDCLGKRLMVCWKIWGFWNSFKYKIVLKTCKISWGNPYSWATRNFLNKLQMWILHSPTLSFSLKPASTVLAPNMWLKKYYLFRNSRRIIWDSGYFKVGVLRASHRISDSKPRICWHDASKFSSISSWCMDFDFLLCSKIWGVC
jgi:hypothetical protein